MFSGTARSNCSFVVEVLVAMKSKIQKLLTENVELDIPHSSQQTPVTSSRINCGVLYRLELGDCLKVYSSCFWRSKPPVDCWWSLSHDTSYRHSRETTFDKIFPFVCAQTYHFESWVVTDFQFKIFRLNALDRYLTVIMEKVSRFTRELHTTSFKEITCSYLFIHTETKTNLEEITNRFWTVKTFNKKYNGFVGEKFLNSIYELSGVAEVRSVAAVDFMVEVEDFFLAKIFGTWWLAAVLCVKKFIRIIGSGKRWQ